jgi:hypothetical protein
LQPKPEIPICYVLLAARCTPYNTNNTNTKGILPRSLLLKRLKAPERRMNGEREMRPSSQKEKNIKIKIRNGDMAG